MPSSFTQPCYIFEVILVIRFDELAADHREQGGSSMGRSQALHLRRRRPGLTVNPHCFKRLTSCQKVLIGVGS